VTTKVKPCASNPGLSVLDGFDGGAVKCGISSLRHRSSSLPVPKEVGIASMAGWNRGMSKAGDDMHLFKETALNKKEL
jgi:hypothetical protein